MKLKTVKPWTNASGIQISGCVKMDEPPGRRPQDPELADREQEMPDGGFPVQVAHVLPRDDLAQLNPKAGGVLRVVVGHVENDCSRGRPGGPAGDSSRYSSAGIGIFVRPTRVSATPTSTAAAPAALVAPSGSPRTVTAVSRATIGTTFE